MEARPAQPSTSKIALTWALMVAVIAFMVVAAVWWMHRHLPVEKPGETLAEVIAHAVGLLKCGGFFLGLGLLFYLTVIVTGCFSCSFKQPIWKMAKVKLWLANMVLIVLLGLGLGFLGGALLGPALLWLGLSAWTALLAPVLLMIAVVQVASSWVVIWVPLEKRIIRKRFRTAGVSWAEVHSAMLVGLSNPGSGFAKRFGAIEEDLGGLWLTPELLMYRGDGEQFALAREQLVQMERRADSRSTTVLGGIAHVILHISLSNSSVRVVRLHTAGHWTINGKRRAMDALAEAITKWHVRRQFVYTLKKPRIPKY